MAQEERREENGRRLKQERRQSGSGMITDFASYSGSERRSNDDRRAESDRRALAS